MNPTEYYGWFQRCKSSDGTACGDPKDVGIVIPSSSSTPSFALHDLDGCIDQCMKFVLHVDALVVEKLFLSSSTPFKSLWLFCPSNIVSLAA